MSHPWDHAAKEFQSSVSHSLTYTTSKGKAKAAPWPAMLRTATLPEPILYEKEGWGIYGNSQDGGNGRMNGHTLTHIGCDCDYPNWSMSRYIWDRPYADGFICEECHTVLSAEAFTEFCRVYNFINNQ